MTDGKKIVSNVFYYFLDLAAVIFFGYLFWILMGKMLEKTQYGILLTTFSLFQIMAVVFTLGFNESLPKFISEFSAKKKMNKVKSFIFFSSNIVFYFSLLLSILILIFSESLSLLLYGSALMTNAFRFLSILLFSGSLAVLLKSIAQGLQDFKKIFVADFAGCVLKILISVYLVFLGLQALAGVFAYTVWYAIIILVMFFGISKFKTRKIEIDKKMFLRFSLYSLLSSLFAILVAQGNVVLLSFLSSFESVAVFGVAFLFGQMIQFVPSVFLGALFPNISEMWAKRKNFVRDIVSFSVKIITIFVLPVSILFIIFSKFLIGLLYSKAYVSASALFPAIILGSFMFGISSIFLITIYSAYRPLRRLFIIAVGAVLNILLSLILIKTFDTSGAALAYFISNLIILVFSANFANKILGFQFSKRTILLIPILLVFVSILIFIQSADCVLKLTMTLLDLTLYFALLIRFKVINKRDVAILDHFPDRFGIKNLKAIAKKMV